MIETEINVLKKVKHKYIVGMNDFFDTPDKLYLFLDYVSGGELFDRIVDEVKHLTTHQILSIKGISLQAVPFLYVLQIKI